MVFLLASGISFAGNFLVRAETGFVREKFTPEYEFQYDRPNIQFIDIAHGAVFGFSAGYRIPVSDAVSMAFLGSATFSSASFGLVLDEPAHFEYEIPRAIGASIVPSFRVGSGVSVFGEFGLLQGYVQEIKTSPVQSSYDFSEWVTGFSAGGGLSCVVHENWEVFGRYSYDLYNDLSYKSYLPDGTHRETINDSPRRMMFTGGFLYHF